MSTPDRLETAAEDLREWTDAVDAALDDAIEMLALCSGDAPRAWVSLEHHLTREVAPEHQAKLLAVCLLYLVRVRGVRGLTDQR